MDINRIFGLHPVLKVIKSRINHLLMFRGLVVGETATVDASFVHEGEVYNMHIVINKVAEPEEAHFEVK